MPNAQSSQFVSATATGTDWRDTSKKILEFLKPVAADDKEFNLGFLYLSDRLADDAGSIVNLFQSVLSIENWVGCTGVGVCANGESHIDVPAISVMIGKFDESDFCVFPSLDKEDGQDSPVQEALKPWLDQNAPMMVLTHGNPLSDADPVHTVENLRGFTDGFLIGGLSSSRGAHTQIANKACVCDLSGAAFSMNVKIATALTQGCIPIGKTHTITRGENHVIEELDEQSALDIFEDDLRSMTMKKIEQNPDDIVLEIDEKTGKEIIPEQYQHLFKGEVHVAFPISESDQQDYLVRNITGMDTDSGTLMVSQNIEPGERILFVHRSEETTEQDLSRMLVSLRERIQKEEGHFDIKGAIYISCAARALDENGNQKSGEMQLIQEVIGDAPLTGFYAGGEILNGRLYGYTGILTLFL